MAGVLRSKILSGFIYGITLLFIISVHCSNSTDSSKNVLRQITNKNNEMLNDAEALFRSSFTEHELFGNVCNDSLEWFAKPNISKGKDTEKLLKEIDQNLNRFHKAFKYTDTKHNAAENPHKSLIGQAVSNIEAQRKNIQTYLKSETSVNETELTIPYREAYEHKLDCCRLSNIYVKFLKDARGELRKHNSRRKKRNKANRLY